MADATQVTIGAQVRCSDGACGKVTRVVVDPVARAVTHLVVEPAHRQGLGRLVPLSLVEATAADVLLSCTNAEFERLEAAEETHFVPGADGYQDYGQEQAFFWPYVTLGSSGVIAAAVPDGPQTVTYDTVPLGEVEVRRGQHVHASDGEIGRVHGLVIDPRNHHVSHVLLAEGHLWGRKDVAIPIGAVTSVDHGIRLSMTKQDVQDLPAVDIDHLTE
jgi:sporulation protein YlmC with PRC-barrel domain